jgi:hypothetical protein
VYLYGRAFLFLIFCGAAGFYALVNDLRLSIFFAFAGAIVGLQWVYGTYMARKEAEKGGRSEEKRQEKTPS